MDGISHISATRTATCMSAMAIGTTVRWSRTTTGSTITGTVTTLLVRLQLFPFSPYLGEFFVTLPYQPPSIFPISSNFCESKIYFLLSRVFVSQRIINNTFDVSNFLIANLIYEAFSSFFKKLAKETTSIISMKYLSIF